MVNLQEMEKQLMDFYAQGQWQEAIDWLGQVNDDQLQDNGSLDYNLSVFYYKLGQLGSARYHLSLAQARGFEPHMVIHNQEVLENHLRLQSVERPKTWSDRLDGYLHAVSYEVLGLCTLLTLVLMTYRLSQRAWTKTSSLILLLICLPLFGKVIYQGLAESTSQAIVLQATVLYSGPGTFFEEFSQVPEGLQVVIARESKGWVLIKSPQSFRGWVRNEHIGMIR